MAEAGPGYTASRAAEGEAQGIRPEGANRYKLARHAAAVRNGDNHRRIVGDVSSQSANDGADVLRRPAAGRLQTKRGDIGDALIFAPMLS